MQPDSSWKYSLTYKSPCKIIDEQSLWGQKVYTVWLQNQDTVVRVSDSDLHPLDNSLPSQNEIHRIVYIAAGAKVAEILEGASTVTKTASEDSNQQILLAPIESNVIPLPHQIYALARALSGDTVRYLLADEVGLGKTIEAGLVLRELKLRGLVHRTLIVAPKSIAIQWVAEMKTHFNENFTLINPSDLDAFVRLQCPSTYIDEKQNYKIDYNPWLKFDQAIVTFDAVKPMTNRRGWSAEKIKEYNQTRYESLIQGEWDLIIVDESHRMAGNTEQVARHKLGQGLAEVAPYLLLLSATPHQGKSDAFQRLMSLLDPMAFPDIESVTREKVEKFIIRTEKRNAVTAEGKPLFRPRIVETLAVDLERNPAQVALYDAVTEYVKKGYNQALKERKPHVGFLMVLLQRIVTSSSHAIRCTLERRLHKLENLQDSTIIPGDDDLEDFSDLDGQTQLELLVEIDEPGRVSEIAEVKDLLDLAITAEISGPDIKTEALMNLIFELQSQENDTQVKLLIFTEFVPTQAMLKHFLEERGISCTILNGSMSMDERQAAQIDFRDKARVLISTDAGGEGLNLQFCHLVINYDLPWNPMRIEQRIGRVDRIGQSKTVKAINFVYENLVESRVREVLEEKLNIIFKDMGIDKASEILDTSLTGEAVEKVMTQVIMRDADPYSEVDKTVKQLQQEMLQVREKNILYSATGQLEQLDISAAGKLRNHPLPDWIEAMTTNYLQMEGCKVKQDLLGISFTWPDGEQVKSAVFQASHLSSGANLLSLENPRVRELAMRLPKMAPDQQLPSLSIVGIPETVSGLWGLFEVCLSVWQAANSQIRLPLNRCGYLPVFISDDEKLFMPTARHIWGQLLSNDFSILGFKESQDSVSAHKKLFSAVEEVGKGVFETLQQTHHAALAREEERGITAFASRRKAIERLGLPEVRKYRLAKLERDEKLWQEELKSVQQIIPEIRLLLALSIDNGGCHV